MKRLLMITAALVALTGAAEAVDMTCRGTLYGTPDLRLIGACYVQGNREALEAVNAACKDDQSCIFRAKVTRRDTPHGMPQSYNVIRIYSVQP
jgi:hypothetical protein